MAAKGGGTQAQLKMFAELQECEGNCKKTLHICEQLLKLLPEDPDVIAYKIKTLLDFSRFVDCAKFIEGEGPKVMRTHYIELAYAYYRLNKLPQAEAALAKGKQDTEAVLHLKAQIEYKKEDYGKAAEMYAGIKAGMEEEEEEIICNLSASIICNGELEKAMQYLNMSDAELPQDLLCNKACVFMMKEQWERAVKCLNAAEKDCKEAHLEEGELNEAALADDLATVRVQQAYIAARLGDEAKAIALLQDVLKNKPSSLSTFAVGSNNLCGLQRDKTVFDAFKRLKPLRDAHYDARLSSDQRLAIRFNTSILMGQMGQRDQGRSLAESICKEDPASPLGPLAVAVMLAMESKYSKAEEVLKAYLKQHATDDATEVKLMLAQLALQQGNLKRVVAQLQEVEKLKHQLGVAATLVAAYEKQGVVDTAASVLDEAITYWRNEKSSVAAANLEELLKASAEFNQRQRRFEEAAKFYRELMKLNPKQVAYKAGLVVCLSKTNVGEAEKLAEDLTSHCDVSTVTPEQAYQLLSHKVREFTAEAQTKNQKESKEDAEKKKKKRRPGKKPANATGEPEVDRWRCWKDRASYKLLTKRQVREIKKEKLSDRMRRQKQAAYEREAQREKLKVHYEGIRNKEA